MQKEYIGQSLMEHPFTNLTEMARALIGRGSQNPHSTLRSRIGRCKILAGTDSDNEFLEEVKILRDACNEVLNSELENAKSKIKAIT